MREASEEVGHKVWGGVRHAPRELCDVELAALAEGSLAKGREITVAGIIEEECGRSDRTTPCC